MATRGRPAVRCGAVAAAFGLVLVACGGLTSSQSHAVVDVVGSFDGTPFKAVDGDSGSSTGCGNGAGTCDLDLEFYDFVAVCRTLPTAPAQYIDISINLTGQAVPGTLDASQAWTDYVRIAPAGVAQTLTNIRGTIKVSSISRGSQGPSHIPTSVTGSLDLTFDQGWLQGTFQLATPCG